MNFNKRPFFFGIVILIFAIQGTPTWAAQVKKSCASALSESQKHNHLEKRRDAINEALSYFETKYLDHLKELSEVFADNGEQDPFVVDDVYYMIFKSLHKGVENDPTRRLQIDLFHDDQIYFSRFFRFRHYDLNGVDIFFEEDPSEDSINPHVSHLSAILRNKKAPLSKVRAFMSKMVDPNLISAEEWRPILLKMTLLTPIFSDEELISMAQSIRLQLRPLAGPSLSVKLIEGDILADFKNELKSLFHFSHDYRRVRMAVVKSGLSAFLDKNFAIHLPDSITLETRLDSNMVDTGDLARFKDLKKGIQNNDIQNPFARYIGRKLKDLPWVKIEKALRAQEASSPLLKTLDRKSLKSLTVYHRTKDPKSAQSIEAGHAYISVGKNSVFGGAATWGDGVYLGFSDKLYWYGAFTVPYKLNENAVIGKDLDLFIGTKDGLIVVVKSDKGLSESDRLINWKAHPSFEEPMINHLHWFAKMAPQMSLKEKLDYVLSTIEESRQNPQWGPFELLLLVHLDQDILVNDNIRHALKRQFNYQRQNLDFWPLQNNPARLIQDFRAFVDSRMTSLEKKLIDPNSPVRQQIESNKNISLINFHYFDVPESVIQHLDGSLLSFENYVKFKNLDAADLLVDKAREPLLRRLNQVLNSFSATDWSSLSLVRYLTIASHLWSTRENILAHPSSSATSELAPLLVAIEDFFLKDTRIQLSLIETYPRQGGFIKSIVRFKTFNK